MSDMAEYTLQEVSANNGLNGSKVWVAIDGYVLDLTDYVEDHPGGAELVTEYAGKDGTKAFDRSGHSNDAIKSLKQYRIGKLKVVDLNDGLPVKHDTDLSRPRRSCISVITCGICG